MVRVAWLVAALGLVTACMPSRSSEILVSRGVTLSTEWQEVPLSDELRTTAEWSELLLEVPGLRSESDSRLLLADGMSIEIKGYLVTQTNQRIDLEKTSAVSYGGRSFVRLSSAALEWKQREHSFRRMSLRSDGRVKVGKIIWMSYDPRTTKTGVAYPRSLD
jgi:hypothetical protein